MRKASLKGMTVTELVERFAANRIEQDQAELLGATRRFRPLFDRMIAIEEELAARPGDQRRALMSLYDHPNHEVRLNAATATLAVAPDAARAALERLHASEHFPQAAEAGMTLKALDEGKFNPT